ncbi:MAG TPA: methionine--tRNA ligase [Fibrobacteria bacterium]|nr:methionine--tRNA ligase [Fibrobacteria bacterium]
MSKTFYITTPIYYVNDAPHIGHTYTTVLADVLTRYHKLAGHDTFFLTGTDEHGLKVVQSAEKRGVTPQEHCDTYSQRFKDAWKELGIGFDKFIRTTDRDHIAFVQDVLRRLWDKGQIYEKEYEGWYSVGEERFFTEKELVDGKDPISGRPVEKVREKNYFFRMGSYQDWLIQHITDNPDFILPDFRRNEVLGFLRQPLQDLCISRPKSRLSWGITLPFDTEYVAYVWVDALFNYRSGVEGRAFPDGAAVWPADYHLLGKDILTTHAVYWPTLLKAADMPMPRHLLAHGWWLFDNARMSKTTGNVVNPLAMKDKYGVDAFRYFLTREMVVGQDASFTEAALVQRINSDLANDVGNGLSRVLKLAAGLGGRLHTVPSEKSPSSLVGEEEIALRKAAEEAISSSLAKVEALKLSFAVEDILQLIRAVNRYLEVKAPWKLAKQGEEARPALNSVLWHAAEALRIGFSLLQPVMPAKMTEALSALGLKPSESPLRWGVLGEGQALAPGLNLFPRIDTKSEGAAGTSAVRVEGGNRDSAAAPKSGNIPSTDPFSLVELRVAKVESVEDHPNADALYVLRVNLGTEQRTLCAGLKKHLTKEELQGRKVVLVANLKPANLRGVESAGMILAAGPEGGKLAPVVPEGAEPGDVVTAPGIAPTPKAGLTLKDFEKAPLRVLGGKVHYRDQALATPRGPVTAEAPDGTEVR